MWLWLLCFNGARLKAKTVLLKQQIFLLQLCLELVKLSRPRLHWIVGAVPRNPAERIPSLGTTRRCCFFASLLCKLASCAEFFKLLSFLFDALAHLRQSDSDSRSVSL